MTFPEPPEHLRKRDLRADDLSDIENTLVTCYGWMHLARTADNRIIDLFRQGLIKGTVTGGQGNETLSASIGLLLDKEIDVVSWTHRDFAGHLIWSGHLVDHLCQYLANSHSPTKAREGNIHHGDPANRSYPMISHLGTMLSNVCGGCDSQRRKGHDAVGMAIFGDGASSTGDVHESLNLASVLNLPIIFIAQNNHYAYSTPTSEQFSGDSLASRAAGYNIEGMALSTDDAEETLRTIDKAISQVRRTRRPVLIDAKTLRLCGHAAYDTCDYLPEGLLEKWEKEDGLPLLRQRLLDAGRGGVLETMEAANKAFIENSLSVAMQFPPQSTDDFAADVFAPTRLGVSWKPAGAPETLTMAQALQRAHHKILSECPESILMGQDIATYGGAFKVTEHLFEEFGRSRVINTPLAESAMVGYATGLALNGHRAIAEFQFSDFATEATTQILLNAGTYHFRSGASVPLVLRFPCGGGLTFGSFHSQDLEAMYTHAPGLKLLYPSTPQDAYNALLAAYEDDNPVLLFEHKHLYRTTRGPVAFDPNYRSVWRPKKIRAGTNGTIVTYGDMVHLTAAAVDYLKEEYDYTFDVFDLRALSPLDLGPIKESLQNTHRICVVHEGRRTSGFGAELVSRLVGDHFDDLDGAPLRIASLDTPVPFAPELEAVYRPSSDSIAESIITWLE